MSSSQHLSKRFSFFQLMNIEGERKSSADEILCGSIEKIQTCLSNPFDWINGVSYKFEDIPYGGLTSRGLIRLNPRGLTEWTVVHELAHVWDASLNWQLSEQLRKATNSGFRYPLLHQWFPESPRFFYHVGKPPAPCGHGKRFNAREDFAESVTAYLFPEEAHRRASKRGFSYEFNGFIHFHDTPRGVFIKSLIHQKTTPS
jgi:hypothetical protein